MGNTNRQLQYDPKRRGVRLSERRRGPFILFAVAACAIVAVLLAVVFFLIPVLRGRIRLLPDANSSSTAVRAEKSPASVDPRLFTDDAIRTVALPEGAESLVLSDASVCGGMLTFSAGTSADQLDRIACTDIGTGETTLFTVPVTYGQVRYPVGDAERLIYVDARATGGGAIRMVTLSSGADTLICQLESDIPALLYEAPYLVWRMRTAESIVKLMAYDVTTGASVALNVFGNTSGARSDPALSGDTVVYADADPQSPDGGVIRSIRLSDGETADLFTDTAAHDPAKYGKNLVWLTGRHGEDSDLYLSEDGGEARRIARGVVDSSVTSWGVVYCRDETVFAYLFSDGRTYVLSPTGANAQLAAADGACVLWRDMTDAAHPVWNYREFN